MSLTALLVALALVFGLPGALEDGASFIDATEPSGLRFTHFNAATQKKYMVETMGSGGGFFDYDGDGDLDVYLVNGAPLPGSESPSPPPGNALFRNEGDGTFVEVTREAGVGDRGYGMGITAGDVDNDGDVDLYVTNFGANVFYRNNGDGTFTDRTGASGLSAGGWSASAAFADYDDDGFLDLYVARYVDFDLDNHKFCGNQAKGIQAYCHPDVYEPVPGILFHGRGDGTFEDVTEAAGLLVRGEGKSLGVVWGDYDDDGAPDLYVANDSMRNFLFRNEGGGRFTDVTLLAGVGYSEEGRTQAGMGTDMADYDGDGRLDLTVTNLDFEYNALYRGNELSGFTDVSYEAGVAETSLNFVGFGTLFLDYDDDGELDLFVANGHIIDNIALFGAASTYAEPNFLFENLGNGTFEEVAARKAPALAAPNVARGAAAGDLDGDGDLDLLVTRCGGPALYARNEVGAASSSLELRLVGRRSNRDGVGARVTVRVGERIWVREVKTATSYLSQGQLDVHFGLGAVSAADEVEIRWPAGDVERLGAREAGRHLAVEPAGRP